MCRGTRSPAGSSGLGVTAVPRRSSDASRYLRRGTAEYQDVDGCTEVSGPARGRGRTERTAGNESEGGEKKKPAGGFKAHGAVLFSRKRLIEASARTGAPLPPASRIHPRQRPRIPRIRTHRARLPRGGASPAASPSPRRSSPLPHGLFGFIHHTVRRSPAPQPRKDFIPPPLAPASSSHTHTGHIPGLGHGSAPVPAARTRRSAARQTDG